MADSIVFVVNQFAAIGDRLRQIDAERLARFETPEDDTPPGIVFSAIDSPRIDHYLLKFITEHERVTWARRRYVSRPDASETGAINTTIRACRRWVRGQT
jgi:hypothetical protein